MVTQVGWLEQILDELSPDAPVELVFVDWKSVPDHETGTPLRDSVNYPVVASAGAMIGHGGFFEMVCNDMVAAVFALNPLDADTRHVDSYAMETYHPDGTYTAVNLADPDQYAEVKAFLERTLAP
ncbi:MAG: hypothetical protein B7733_00405 [Myxococcales bacterium FL481]|nr:MAG: hypothetical protein B7733_00405 [Myxococcales bacterium FL481]